jgi:hypothetical protein
VLDEMRGSDRAAALGGLGSLLGDKEITAELKQQILGKIFSLHGSPGWQDEFRIVAGELGGSISATALHKELEAAHDPVQRAFYLSAFVYSMGHRDQLGGGRIPANPKEIWESLSPDLRSEVAAEALHANQTFGDVAFDFARQALADGNLDALKAAADHRAFETFADNTEQPLELAEWALTLPDDPRAIAFYRRAMQGAAVNDFPAIRDRVLALPPGWQRDTGLEALAYGGRYSDQTPEEVEPLLEQISNPALRDNTLKEYRAQQKAAEE